MLLDDLLRAVRDAPNEFGPLLAYADALAAAGDPLAELIRVQCALARGGLTADERVTLHGRDHALLAAHEDAWLGPLRGVVYRKAPSRLISSGSSGNANDYIPQTLIELGTMLCPCSRNTRTFAMLISRIRPSGVVWGI